MLVVKDHGSPARNFSRYKRISRTDASRLLNLTPSEADLRIAMLTAKLELLDGPPHTL
jgi:hypothetical protein